MLSALTSSAKKAENNIGAEIMPEAQYNQFFQRLTIPKQYKRFKPILNRGGEIPMNQTGNKLNTVYSFSNGMDSISSNQPIQSNAIKAGDGISEDNLRMIREMNGGYSTDASGNRVPNYTVTPNQSSMGGGVQSYSVKSPMGINSTYSPQQMKSAMANNQVNYLSADGQPFQMQEGGELPQYLNPQAPVQNKQAEGEMDYIPGTYMAKYFK